MKKSLAGLLLMIGANLVFLSSVHSVTPPQSWVQLFPTSTSPEARAQSGNAYDEANDRLIIFAGATTPGPSNDIWILAGAAALPSSSSWLRLSPTGAVPQVRGQTSAVYDPTSNRLIVHGGFSSGVVALNDVWALNFANGLGGTPQWIPLPSAPIGRVGHVAAYDAVSNRMIVFSGNTGPPGTERNDVWILKDANGSGSPAWEQLFPTGSLPPARTHSQGFYDPLTNRLVIFAGRAAGSAFNDVWILEHANGLGGVPNWTQVLPGGIPPARRGGHIMFYDAQRNRSIIFGGGDEQADPIFNDTWILTEANGLGGTPQWIQLAPTGGPPIARFWPSAGYSKSTNRLVVTMGNQQASPFYTADTWVLNDESNMPPACVAPPAGMVGWWPGDGDANDIADGNHGTLQNGTAFVPGMIGQAFSFDGIDDYVSIPNSPNLQLPDTAFTITLWFKTTSLARAEGQVLLSKGVSDANEEYNIQLSVDGSILWDYAGLLQSRFSGAG